MNALYKKKCEEIIYNLKNIENHSITLPKSYQLPNGQKVEFKVVSQIMIQNKVNIQLLARWREIANPWFPRQFTVTENGTKKWAIEQLHRKSDRILFFLYIKGENKPFAHLGLNRFNYQKKSAEIDNVVRGIYSNESKGAMKQAIKNLSKWAMKKFDLSNILLTVFSDNKKAIALYEHSGFHTISKKPLEKIVQQKDTIWNEVLHPKKNTLYQRYNVKMKLL
jgi:RimJ/RimL family protein N-acetyltransferase